MQVYLNSTIVGIFKNECMVMRIIMFLTFWANVKCTIAQAIKAPYNVLTDLSDSQRMNIVEIQSRTKKEIPMIYKKHVDSLIDYHNRMKTLFLIERDTSNLLFRIQLSYDATEF